MNSLEDAIRDASKGYFYKGVPIAFVIAIASAVNTYLGRESNEGEKLARRNVAVDAIRFAMRAGPGLTLKEVDEIIKNAQG